MHRILVVDEEADICEMISNYFNDVPGTDVTCAVTATLGDAKLRSERFDLALVDAAMPVISGLSLAETAASKDMPVLLLSGNPDVSALLGRFGFPYVVKPFSLDALLSESQRIIAHSQKNLADVKASALRMKAAGDALKDAMADSQRLIADAKRLLDDRPNAAPIPREVWETRVADLLVQIAAQKSQVQKIVKTNRMELMPAAQHALRQMELEVRSLRQKNIQSPNGRGRGA